MNSRRLFSYDPLTGISRYFHPSDDGNTFGIETVMDAEPILEANKTLLWGESSKGRNWRGSDMHRVARIPLHIYMELDEKGILNDDKKMKAWLNDPENRYYRTKGGRV